MTLSYEPDDMRADVKKWNTLAGWLRKIAEKASAIRGTETLGSSDLDVKLPAGDGESFDADGYAALLTDSAAPGLEAMGRSVQGSLHEYEARDRDVAQGLDTEARRLPR